MPEQSLPQRPDLAQLRRQAKELRDALRRGEKGAIERLRRYSQVDAESVTLSAAQLVIAREHGFPSWPQLKERVETSARPAELPDSLADSARHYRLKHRLFASGFKRAVPAVELEARELVVIEGRVLAIAGDTDDGSRVRLTIVQALGPPPGDQPDPHEIVLICPADMILLTARHYVSNADIPHGDGMHLPEASLIYEDALPARDVVSGQVVMLDGQLISTDAMPADPGLLRLTLVSGVRPPRGSSPDRREIFLVCPRETIMTTVTRNAGWPVDKSVAADELEDDQAVILKGRVVGCTSDPSDPERVRFTFVSSLGDQPDERELVLSVPRNMEFVTIHERD
jgi:hypothetical protein